MQSIELIERTLTGSVIGAFFDVYNGLGFGFLEHISPSHWSVSSLSVATPSLARWVFA
ncbi:MAG: hypothetical protein ACT4PJ_10165 [Gemmatimonadaceae bacterium]